MKRSARRSWWLLAAASVVGVMGACSEETIAPPAGGSIQLTVTTTGTDLDPDGYTALVDGGSGQVVGANGSVTFASLTAGAHDLLLQGVAANCSVANNPRSVTVTAGQTAQTTFDVTCVAPTGSVVVTATTTGVNQDSDGYTALIDAANGQAVAVNGSATFLSVEAGSRQVSLAGLAANCSAANNPRAVTVTAGQIATTTFNVVCAPIITDLEVVTLTTGQDIDADGYTFAIDAGVAQAIGVNDSLTVGAAAGNRSVLLAGVANNCVVAGTNPRAVSVPTSGSARVDFVVSCTSTKGSLVVTTTTTGVDQDPNGYTVTVDGGISQAIGVTATVTLNNVPAGVRTVTLTGIAGNCTVAPQNPRTVTVAANASVQTDFAINCAAITGTVDVVASTSGVDLDPNGYTVSIQGVADAAVGVNDTVSVAGVVWGDRTVELKNLSSNCSVTGQNPRTVTVPQNGTVETTFVITCAALTGTLTVNSSTTGANLDANGYTVAVDGGAGQALATNGSSVFTNVTSGNRSVLLTGIAPNCSVTGSNPAIVAVPALGGVSHTFNLTCTTIVGSVQVTTATTGTSLDADGYMLTVEGATPVAITINETKTVSSVAVGTRTVELTGIASNCTVGGLNPRTVAVTDGGTVSTTFNVTCTVTLSNKIVFDTDREGHFDIHVMNPDGSSVQRLTTNAARDAEPNVSPDGGKIAFVSDRDGNNEIYVMNADGTGQTRLTNNGASDSQPAWSNDGTKIAFRSNRDGNNEIYFMNANGSSQTRLTNDAGADALPDWSPDGTKIVFNSDRDGDQDIWVMNAANGTGLLQLTNNAGSDFAASWSPNGTMIAFSSEQDGDAEIYTMNANGSSQTALTSNTVGDVAPQWSPNGSQIAFASSRDGDNEVYTMNANGSSQTNRTNNAGADDFEVDWSP